MNDPIEIAAIMAEFYALNGYLDAVVDALSAGLMPDITGFEHRVAQLCEMIKLEPGSDQRHQYRESLGDLLERLDHCEKQMRAFHAAKNPPETP